jgi:hypothetical protein
MQNSQVGYLLTNEEDANCKRTLGEFRSCNLLNYETMTITKPFSPKQVGVG